jgi:hypothetical protein
LQAADWIATWSFVVAAISLIAALVSIYIAVYAVSKSNKNSSVATMVTLNEAFSEAWRRLISSIKAVQCNPQCEDDRYMHLSELMNLFEAACGIQNENSLSGVSKELIDDYLDETLNMIVGDEYIRSEIPKMLTAPTTFKHIKKYLKSKRNLPLRYIIPVEWYEL